MGDAVQEGLLADVLSQYDIGILRAVSRHGGTAGAGNWRIETDRGVWLLRTRGPRTSTDDVVAFDHALRRHLVGQGVPTAAPVARRDGQTFVREAGRVFEVYPLVPGRSCTDASDARLQSAARGLAGFHQAVSSFPEAEKVPAVPQYGTLGIQDASARPEDPALLRRAYEPLLADPATMPYAEEAGCCRLWIERLEERFGDHAYGGLHHVLTHGDYTLANLLFDEQDNLTGIFDFDWARWAPRVRDLADGMYFIGGVRRAPLDPGDIWSLTDASEFRVDRCALWLRAYGEAAPLLPQEVRAVPLAFAARWLSVRIEGTAKVPVRDRSRFSFRDMPAPLRWLEERWSEVEGAL
jgi:Ser/Thr protein kinase RdoA (MazF antagonist)